MLCRSPPQHTPGPTGHARSPEWTWPVLVPFLELPWEGSDRAARPLPPAIDSRYSRGERAEHSPWTPCPRCYHCVSRGLGEAEKGSAICSDQLLGTQMFCLRALVVSGMPPAAGASMALQSRVGTSHWCGEAGARVVRAILSPMQSAPHVGTAHLRSPHSSQSDPAPPHKLTCLFGETAGPVRPFSSISLNKTSRQVGHRKP